MITYLNDALNTTPIVFKASNNINVLSIRKNASTSLAAEHYYQYSLNEIKQLEYIDVFIREPFKRYVSAVQTVLHSDDMITYDIIQKYLFLDPHTNLQFNYVTWLMSQTSAKIRIREFSEITDITSFHKNKSKKRNDSIYDKLKLNKKLEYFLQFDQVLYYNLMSKTIDISDIIMVLKKYYPSLYNEQILTYHKMTAQLTNI